MVFVIILSLFENLYQTKNSQFDCFWAVIDSHILLMYSNYLLMLKGKTIPDIFVTNLNVLVSTRDFTD